jgi:hypothetical protein
VQRAEKGVGRRSCLIGQGGRASSGRLVGHVGARTWSGDMPARTNEAL